MKQDMWAIQYCITMHSSLPEQEKFIRSQHTDYIPQWDSGSFHEQHPQEDRHGGKEENKIKGEKLKGRGGKG